jgi:Skp family chaperone for outer membrane proteins
MVKSIAALVLAASACFASAPFAQSAPTPGTYAYHQQLIREARVRVEVAQKAYEDIRDNTTESDFHWVEVPAARGAQFQTMRRRVPTEDYFARFAARVEELKKAEEELKALERSVEF